MKPSSRGVEQAGQVAAPAPHLPLSAQRPRARHLRLLSYNIQVALSTGRYRHYITRSWRHVLPSADRMPNLDRIAHLVRDYDIVGLQETDAGSLRSRNVNQVRYLADHASFPFWNSQVNRDLGKLAQHSLGFLSRVRPGVIQEYKLPGMIPGRGVLVAKFGAPERPLVLVVTHLALGPRTRRQQLAFISELIGNYEHVILMGDTNCEPQDLIEDSALRQTGLRVAPQLHKTYPSWQPRRNIDHILVTPSLQIHRVEVIDERISDHLPIAMEVVLPDDLDLGRDEEAEQAG